MSVVTVSDAVRSESMFAYPRGAEPSMKATLPCGLPDGATTVASRTTGIPAAVGFAETLSAVCVTASELTVNVTTLDRLALKVAEPSNLAEIECVPAGRLVVSMARPGGSSGAEPNEGPPSGNGTPPDGTRPVVRTNAVSDMN